LTVFTCKLYRASAFSVEKSIELMDLAMSRTTDIKQLQWKHWSSPAVECCEKC